MENIFYCYAYLREDGSPYYVGKGKNNRAYVNQHNVGLPPRDRIVFLRQNLLEGEAYEWEKFYIAHYGRKDLGTGILRNLDDGGPGCPNMLDRGRGAKISKSKKGKKNRKPMSEEHKKLRSEALKGRKKTKAHNEAVSRAKMGHKHSEETKKKISESKLGTTSGNKGKKRTTPVSEETREKIRQAALRRWKMWNK